jgi:YVTN family beta-propeller protein
LGLERAGGQASGAVGEFQVPAQVEGATSGVVHLATWTRRWMTTDQGSHTVSVINTATNTVVATVTVGDAPAGVAIGGALGARRPQKHHQGMRRPPARIRHRSTWT